MVALAKFVESSFHDQLVTLSMWSASIYHIANTAYRTIIPVPERRIPICRHHVPRLVLPLIPFLLMAYLSRRPHTFHLRLSLLPLVICLTLATYFGFMHTAPELNVYNWGQGTDLVENIRSCNANDLDAPFVAIGLFAEVICAKAIDLAWRKEGMLKTGEVKPGVLSDSPSGFHCPNGSTHADASPADCNEKPRHTAIPRRSSLPPWLYDSFEVVLATRGLGWQFSNGVHVPVDRRPSKHSAFLLATAISTAKHFLIFDAMEAFIKLVPEVGSPHGGTIFRPKVPILQRCLLSTAIHLATGTCLISGFEFVHGFISLIALTALSSHREMWPPLMDNPWISDSLHVFWAKRWHQVLRQTFFIYGGFPGKWLAGDTGMLFGTFFASGMFHECSAYLLGRGFSWFVVVFFTLQALLLLLEKLWRHTTGRRVGGLYGMLWVHFCIFVMAQPLVDSWHSRGLAGGLMVPPQFSPTRRILLPLLRRVERTVGFGPLSAVETFLSGSI